MDNQVDFVQSSILDGVIDQVSKAKQKKEQKKDNKRKAAISESESSSSSSDSDDEDDFLLAVDSAIEIFVDEETTIEILC